MTLLKTVAPKLCSSFLAPCSMSKHHCCALKIMNGNIFKAMLVPVHFEHQALLKLSPVECSYILASGPGSHLWKTCFFPMKFRGVLMRELELSFWWLEM